MRIRRVLAGLVVPVIVLGSLLSPTTAAADDGLTPSSPRPPARLALSGVLRVVPFEAPPVRLRIGQSPADVAVASGKPTVTLFIDDDTRVNLSGAAVESATSGSRFSGTVAVPAAVARTVERRVVSDSLRLDDSETAQLVAEVADASSATLAVIAGSISPVKASAATPKQHKVEAIYLAPTGQPLPSAATITAAAVTRLGAYWSEQSNGQVSSVALQGAVLRRNVTIDVCDPYTAWDYATSAFGKPESYYWGATNSVHLVVIVPGSLCGEGIGLGTTSGSIHVGGLVWASVEETTPADWNGVLFHEVGHNLGLGHSNERVCTRPAVDAPFNRTTWAPSGTCEDVEYADIYDVMGMGYSVVDGAGNTLLTNSTNVAALDVTHKAKLDALPRGSALGLVTTGGGYEQSLTVSAAGGSMGVRGLEIADPSNGEKLYVEYRAGVGRDTDAFYTGWSAVMGDDELAPGVRVLRRIDASGRNDAYSTAIRRWRDGLITSSLWYGAGEQVKTHTGAVTVKVVSTSATSAVVQVGFYTAFATSPTPRISVVGGGAASFGSTLSADGAAAAAWDPDASAVAYQWLRDGALISGATKRTYQPTGADIGHQISVRATATRSTYRPTARTSTAVAVEGPTTARIAGATRYEVAVNVSNQAFAGTAPVVFVATGTNYPDALSAAPVAADAGGPLLLVPTTGAVPKVVLDRVASLAPARIVVVGGPGSVSDAVVAQVGAAHPAAILERVGGANRYVVSRDLISRQWPVGETVGSVYIATGRSYPDALSAAPVAGSKGVPVILVDGQKTSLDGDTVTLLKRLEPTSAYIAGGPGSVSPGIEAQLGSLGYAVTRYGGADRYEASANVNAGSFSAPTVPKGYFASGLAFADALSGAVLAAVNDSPLFVVRQTCVPPKAAGVLAAKSTDQVTLIGGPATLTPAVESLALC